MFSNARRVLSQCNTRLRLLYLLNKYIYIYIYIYIYLLHLHCNTHDIPDKERDCSAPENFLTLVYFLKMAQLLISLITNSTVAVLEIHVTNLLWFMAIESLTNKVNDSIAN